MFSPEDIKRATVAGGVNSKSIEIVAEAIIKEAGVRTKNEGDMTI